MGIWKSFAGMIRIEFVSAEPEYILQLLNSLDIHVFNVQRCKPLTVMVTIYREQFKVAAGILRKHGCSVRIAGRYGVYWALLQLLHRPVLCIGIALLLCLWMYVPSRVLFIRVTGCQEISPNLIVEKANSCGLSFGMSRREVRSERVKNALLEQIPQLQWVGVNTVGCVATISVSEKKTGLQEEEPYEVSHIVALRDGVIDSCTVTKGNLLCRLGDAVVKGQMLVSGYTDCGITIMADRASAEIYAQTRRDQKTIMMTECIVRGKLVNTKTHYRLMIGDRQYQLGNNQAAIDDCKKIVEVYNLTLPGGFHVPITLIKETYYFYETAKRDIAPEMVYELISDFAERYVSSRMVGGMITEKKEFYEDGEAYCCLDAVYLCRELIGVEVCVKTLPDVE